MSDSLPGATPPVHNLKAANILVNHISDIIRTKMIFRMINNDISNKEYIRISLGILSRFEIVVQIFLGEIN